MSGECGYGRVPFLCGSSSAGKGSEEVAKLASATLSKLNSMMREMSNWRDERLVLESNVNRLKSALEKLGESPDEALGPDPMLVHQRSEINRLELTTDRLEDEVRSLREALLEADQAITCSGAKRLKEKMIKTREDRAEERRKLKDEIGHLKLRVQEAEEESSCSSLSRLRVKLREILKVDKKMERMIADVASRSCGTLIDLSNELTRIKELLDESRLENIRLNGERRRLKAAFESAPNSVLVSGCSGYLETIERLGFHVRELERKIKDFEDDSGLVERVEELEEALNENRKELEAQEAVVTSLRNEITGAKTAYKIKSEELDGLQDSKRECQALREVLEGREELVADLERRLKLSVSTSQDVERLRDELSRVKAELLSLEITRDGLLDDIEKMGIIVSDRNEHIVKILEETETRETARRSEIEGVRTRLCIACAENERLKLRCEDLEEELSKSNETSRASGDRSAPFVKKIKELEEELAGLKRPSYPVKKDFPVSNSEVKTLEFRVDGVETSKVRLEKKKQSSDFGSIIENGERIARLVERLNKLKTENGGLKNELDDLKEENLELRVKIKIENKMSELRDRDTQTNENFEEKLTAVESTLRKVIAERDTLKNEYKKLTCENRKLNAKVEESKTKVDELTEANESLNEKMNGYEGMREKLETVEDQLEKALGEVNTSKATKRSIDDDLRAENERLKSSLKKERQERSELEIAMEKLRVEVEEQSKTLRVKNETEKSQGSGLRREGKTETLVMNCGDYVRADRELKYYIHLQSLAVKRVVDFISYVDGGASLKPAMAKFLEPGTTTNQMMVLNLDENITATFTMSQKLSAKIFAAEIDVQKLETLKNERNILRAERDCLNKGMEKVSKMLNKLGKEISVPRDLQVHDDFSAFENETEKLSQENNNTWYLTSPKNSNYYYQSEEDGDEKFSGINIRISALKMQIKYKQEEAKERLIEMRETMRQERIRLMEIADRENVPT